VISVAGVAFENKPALNGWVLFSGVILIVLAEVFRLGAEMKGDLETARRIQFDLVPAEAFRGRRRRPRPNTARQKSGRPCTSSASTMGVAASSATPGKVCPAALLTSIVGSARALLAGGLRVRPWRLSIVTCAGRSAGRFVTSSASSTRRQGLRERRPGHRSCGGPARRRPAPADSRIWD
jgi:hypothetical protein